MDQSLLTLVLTSSEKREVTEWLDLKSKVEEEKFRKASADLERRRMRKYNHHLEEQKKVEKELTNLQNDRLRFEREKQLRRRNMASIARERKHSLKAQAKDKESTLPMNETSLGGSASIAFDPKVEKFSRRKMRRAKTTGAINLGKINAKAEKNAINSESSEETPSFPYLSEEDVRRVHQTCKSASRSSECRRWGAAWLSAKKEQDLALEKNKRWTTLLINVEKEKMKALSEKWAALREKRFPDFHIQCSSLASGYVEKTNRSKEVHDQLLEDTTNNKDSNELSVEDIETGKEDNYSEWKAVEGINVGDNEGFKSEPFSSHSSKYKINRIADNKNERPQVLFVSPFSKGLVTASIRDKEPRKNYSRDKVISSDETKVDVSEPFEDFDNVAHEKRNATNVEKLSSNSVRFLPELISHE